MAVESPDLNTTPSVHEASSAAEPVEAAPVLVAQEVEQEEEAPVVRTFKKPSRPDLSSVKVMKASTGDFLGKKEGE